jgi:oxygen-independent coproporphyrinogen-3 oxidase
MTRWRESWEKARSVLPNVTHGLPVPVWAGRGFTDIGKAAWSRLAELVPGRRGAISVYVHLPFCQTRCPFCDCHSEVLPRGRPEVVAELVRRILRETELWRGLCDWKRRPVTTIHFGGGTPLAIGLRAFGGIVNALAGAFVTHSGTEWAIETTCRCLDSEHVRHLADLGFTRVHVGVQTLQPALRRSLVRREAPSTVLTRIQECLQRGWVVSVDMLYGLPGQSVPMLLADLEQLVNAGIHGVSLYRLNHGPHNHRFMLRHGLTQRGADRVYADYCMFREAAALLAARGFAKNHFTHFARWQDRNLYSRHALRGEDLVALGPTADGEFGNYYYRHGSLTDYLGGQDEEPALQGGGGYTHAECCARPLVVQLMAGQVNDDRLDATASRFVRRLADAELLFRDAPSNCWRLSDAGSWFIGACTTAAFHLYANASVPPARKPAHPIP